MVDNARKLLMLLLTNSIHVQYIISTALLTPLRVFSKVSLITKYIFES